MEKFFGTTQKLEVWFSVRPIRLVIGMEERIEGKRIPVLDLKTVIDFSFSTRFFGSSLEMSVGLDGREQLLKEKKYVCFTVSKKKKVLVKSSS